MNDNSLKIIEVDIDDVLPNRFQPRIQFDEAEILELSDSIKEHGVIQPIVVRTVGDKYEIIAGERRYKASVLAGKETVPVVIKNLNDKDSAEVALIENVQRKNLTPIEEALSYKKILDMGYLTQEDLASKLCKSQPSIANKIRLLNLSDEVQEALLENKISERHARSLLRLKTSKEQNNMLNRIINERLTVRRTDEEIEKINEETLSETEKIIEKGEINMNNNLQGITNIPQQPVMPEVPSVEPVIAPQPTVEQQPISVPNFDIFGGQTIETQQPVMPEVPSVEPVIAPQPTVEQQPISVPNFDIFGGQTIETQQPVMPEVPSVEPVIAPQPTVEQQPISVPNFDIFGGQTIETQQPVMPEVPSVEPVIAPQPTVEQQPISVPNFDIFGGQTIETQQPLMPEVPSVEPMAAPVIDGGFKFDTNGNVIEAPQPTLEQQQINEVPVSQPEVAPTSVIQPIEVPQTSPIIESPSTEVVSQQSDNLFSFGTTEIAPVTEPEQQPVISETPITQPEFKMPEPIIITDYTKQYDPVMPIEQEEIKPAVDFKEVINAIRECSNKIEQYGFKIDVEEYDLANLYQVIFKIEK